MAERKGRKRDREVEVKEEESGENEGDLFSYAIRRSGVPTMFNPQ